MVYYLYHPNRHDQVIAVEGVEAVGHAEDGAGAALQGGFVDHAEDAGEAFIGRGGLFDLQRAKLSVAFKNHVDLLGVAVAVKVQLWLQSRVLVALHDLRDGIVLQ